MCLIRAKINNQPVERTVTDRQYHVQGNAGVSNQDVRIICNTNQFTSLPFYGPHSKSRGARELSKHYHLYFDPKLGNGVC